MGAIKNKYPGADKNNNPYREGSAHYKIYEACASDQGISIDEILSIAPSSKELNNAKPYIYNINRECTKIVIDEIKPGFYKMK